MQLNKNGTSFAKKKKKIGTCVTPVLTRNNARVGTGIDCGPVDVTIRNAIGLEKMFW